MLNQTGTRIWMTLGLFAVLAMNANLDYSNHDIRIAQSLKGQSHLASEHKVRFGDCNLNVRGKFDEGIITTDGMSRDFELQCDTGCEIPNQIKRVTDVNDIADLARRLEDTVQKAGYECKDGKIVKATADRSTTRDKKDEEKEEDSSDFYAKLEKMAEKCDDEEESYEVVECLADVLEDGLESQEFRKDKTGKAAKALKRLFNKKFKDEFKMAYEDETSDSDRVDLWDSLTQVMALKESRNGKLVAKEARELKNSVIGSEAKKIAEMRNDLNMVCSGLISAGVVNPQMMNTFKCNTLRKQLPMLEQQVNFELSQYAAPSIANAYLDADIVGTPAQARSTAYSETFSELYRQFAAFSNSVTSDMMAFANSRQRSTTNAPTFSQVNKTLGYQGDISKLLNPTFKSAQAPKAVHAPMVSTSARSARAN